MHTEEGNGVRRMFRKGALGIRDEAQLFRSDPALTACPRRPLRFLDPSEGTSKNGMSR